MKERAKGLLESNTGEGKRGSKTGEELSDHQAELAKNHQLTGVSTAKLLIGGIPRQVEISKSL